MKTIVLSLLSLAALALPLAAEESIKIPAEQTVTEPATEAKSFSENWVYSVVIMAPDATGGRITIELLPYNAATGEIGKGADKVTLSTDQLWRAVAEVPSVKMAMGAILSAIPDLRAWIRAREAEANSEQ